MQQIKWFCDSCEKETSYLTTVSIHDLQQKQLTIGPRYNGLVVSADGVAWKPSTDYDLCSDCIINIKNLLKAKENV